jgi:methyl-accepting chemotaxis protein
MAYKRSVFLINKPFQLRFAFYVCSWLFVLTMVYPMSIQTLFNSFMDYVRLDPKGPELTKLDSIRSEMTQLLILLQAGFLGITFLVSIFISHRIAGPLYKLRQFFNDAAAGKIHQRLKFRKSDHFQELAESYNQMMDQLGGALTRSSHHIDLAIQEIERAMQNPGAPREGLEKSLKLLKEARQETGLEKGV